MKAIRVQMEDLPQPDRSALDYCRKLISEGVNPKTPLRVYRGKTLALKIKNIECGSKHWVNNNEFVTYNPRYAKNSPLQPTPA